MSTSLSEGGATFSQSRKMVRYECVRAKSLLSKPIVGDSWFHINRSLNAYRGCEHACAYCDGMSEHYYVDDFSTHIRIKENAPEVLRQELKHEGFRPRSELASESLLPFLDEGEAARLSTLGPRRITVGVCGGVSDGFQPAENDHRVTHGLLETLLDFRLPAMVLTKSDLVLRDLDLIREIDHEALANVMFTITLVDDEQQAIVEPKASSTSERFDALREVRRAGIHGGVMAVPIIPYVGSNRVNMEGLAREAKRAGAEFIVFGGLTLKPGRQKDYFLNVVRTRFPDSFNDIVRSYANNDRYGRPIWHELPSNTMLLGHQICERVGISDRSIRHGLKEDPSSNIQVLRNILDIAFYQSFMLGSPPRRSRPFQELAARLEKGVPDLKSLRDGGELARALSLDDQMLAIVEEIMNTGSCSYLKSLLDSASEKAEGDQVFVAFPDEQSL